MFLPHPVTSFLWDCQVSDPSQMAQSANSVWFWKFCQLVRREKTRRILFLIAPNEAKQWILRFPLWTCLAVHGVEYAFGAHDCASSGVFEVEPRQCPGFKFRKSIFIGTTSLDPVQVRQFMELQAASYNGDTYHLISKNCNHFCKDICYWLTGKPIPKWVNRLARIGKLILKKKWSPSMLSTLCRICMIWHIHGWVWDTSDMSFMFITMGILLYTYSV